MAVPSLRGPPGLLQPPRPSPTPLFTSRHPDPASRALGCRIPQPRFPPWRQPRGLLRGGKGGPFGKWARVKTLPLASLVLPGGEAGVRAPEGFPAGLARLGRRGETERDRSKRRFLLSGLSGCGERAERRREVRYFGLSSFVLQD
ncbi:unnamed protein product [Coccothraustes coccothraustes]